MTDPDMKDPGMTNRLEELVERSVATLGLDLDAVESSRSGSRRVLRIAVDADGGVPVDTIADATRVLSAALDSDDVMGDRPYTLEVTSRGVDRPLTLPRHWRRNIGRLVVVDLVDDSRVKGRIASTGDDDVELTVDRVSHRIALGDVTTARVQAELKRPQPDQPRPDQPRPDQPRPDRSSPDRTTHPDKDV